VPSFWFLIFGVSFSWFLIWYTHIQLSYFIIFCHDPYYLEPFWVNLLHDFWCSELFLPWFLFSRCLPSRFLIFPDSWSLNTYIQLSYFIIFRYDSCRLVPKLHLNNIVSWCCDDVILWCWDNVRKWYNFNFHFQPSDNGCATLQKDVVTTSFQPKMPAGMTASLYMWLKT
jgi:hypothetical protein